MPPPQRSVPVRLVVLLVLLGILVTVGAVNALRMTTGDPDPVRVGSAYDPANVPALTGYTTSLGIHGRPIAATAPWGYECAAVVLALDPAMPAAMSKQMRAVVETARHDGLNIAAVRAGTSPPEQSLAGPPSSWIVVPVSYSTATPPPNDVGRPQGLGGTFTTVLRADGRYEHMRRWKLVAYGQTLGTSPLQARRAARLMVARMTGVGGGMAPSSGIARSFTSKVDGFTDADLAAMHAMSGCPVPAKPIP
jgi:hypothetical protein